MLIVAAVSKAIAGLDPTPAFSPHTDQLYVFIATDIETI